MNMTTNIDDVRARIMALESAAEFDQRAWALVLMALGDRPSARADAARRMATAKGNQRMATAGPGIWQECEAQKEWNAGALAVIVVAAETVIV